MNHRHTGSHSRHREKVMWGHHQPINEVSALKQQASAIANVSRRRFIRTTTGGVIFAATAPTLLQGCSPIASIPDSATEAWRFEPETDDIRHWALAHAILAPNPHNLQPWLVDLSTENQIEVSIDPGRLLPETDPFGRQIVIGTGAMIALLELAAATRGYGISTTWLDSRSESVDKQLVTGSPLIRVQFEKLTTTRPNAKNLFNQIRYRHTVRGNYNPDRMPDSGFESALKEFTSNGQSFGLLRSSTDTGDHEQISQWVRDAWEIELSTPATMMESMHLLRVGSREIDQHRDGIAIESPLIVALAKLGLMNRSEPPAPGSSVFNQQIDGFNQSIESTPGWFWLSSGENNRMEQLRAGRTYVLAQLQATQMGMVMHPVSQGLQEYKEMHPVYEQLQKMIQTTRRQTKQTLQMLTRIGYLPDNAAKPKPSPRRGLNAHIL